MDKTKEEYKRKVDKFFNRRKQRQKRFRPDFSLQELIKNLKPLAPGIVDSFFEENRSFHVADEVVEQVRQALHAIRKKVNSIKPEKRMFILETVDFFRSRGSIENVLTALLLLRGAEQKKELFDFFRSTFSTLNRNIETIISTPELFKADSLHVDRGSLYMFAADLAKIGLKLFKTDFVEEFEHSNSDIDLLQKVFKKMRAVKLSDRLEGEYPALAGIVEDAGAIRETIFEYVKAIQCHEALYLYAEKRHRYYRLFLSNLTKTNKIKGIDSIDVSKIFAGCLLKNKQLTPEKSLVEAMTEESVFNSPQTLKARAVFIGRLSPSTVYSLIEHIRSALQNIDHDEIKEEAESFQKRSVKSILKRVWKKD